MLLLAYVSSATHLFSKEELIELLSKSRENNTRAGLTGLLLYKDGNFMQVLEGEEGAVRDLYARIARDPRHNGIFTLLERHTEGREFPDWAMGFRDLNSPEVRDLPGYSEFLNTDLTSPELKQNPSRCRKLLLTFRESIR